MSDMIVVERLRTGMKKSGILALIGTVVAVCGLALTTIQANRQMELAKRQADMALRADDLAKSALKQTDDLQKEIASLREALSASRMAIVAFHQGDYATALKYYDAALKADPKNAYLLNLRAYALFKQHKYEDALVAQMESIEADPAYAWGYFDLARFQC